MFGNGGRKHDMHSAWAEFEKFLKSFLPSKEANELLAHAWPRHERRWKEHEKLKHEIRHRRITEDDYEG